MTTYAQVRGIGQWTVEMLLIFRLGRPDVFPVSDYGVRKGFALTFGKLKPADKVTPMDLPKPDIMHRRAKKWALALRGQLVSMASLPGASRTSSTPLQARKPEGMWLAETAANRHVLDLMAQEGIQFSILAPSPVRPDRSAHSP